VLVLWSMCGVKPGGRWGGEGRDNPAMPAHSCTTAALPAQPTHTRCLKHWAATDGQLRSEMCTPPHTTHTHTTHTHTHTNSQPPTCPVCAASPPGCTPAAQRSLCAHAASCSARCPGCACTAGKRGSAGMAPIRAVRFKGHTAGKFLRTRAATTGSWLAANRCRALCRCHNHGAAAGAPLQPDLTSSQPFHQTIPPYQQPTPCKAPGSTHLIANGAAVGFPEPRQYLPQRADLPPLCHEPLHVPRTEVKPA
jgi:hypothetical protein